MGHSTVDYNEVGGKGKSLLLEEAKKRRSSLFLTELIIFSEGVWGFKKQQQYREEQGGVRDRTSREASDSWCVELYTVGIHFLIIPLGQSFPLHSSAMKQPPYGTFGKGHYFAPQRAGVRGESGHQKYADTSILGTVKGAEVMGGIEQRD